MNESEILIIGANGQLGRALSAKYPKAKAIDISNLDVSDAGAVESYDWTGVKTIINAAAYTNVDGAETPEGRVSAWKANSIAPRNLVQIATKNHIRVVHISTDYVFDGTNKDHLENEDFSPLSVYGASKAAGDIVMGLLSKYYILRTSWVIGDGNNFVRTMLDLGKKGVNPSVVSDQIGRLTFTSELVRGIDHLLTNNVDSGTYNLSNGGDSVSWAEIARHIFTLAKLNSTVTDVTTKEYYSGKLGIAMRPLQSTLNLGKLEATSFISNDWASDLSKYIAKEQT